MKARQWVHWAAICQCFAASGKRRRLHQILRKGEPRGEERWKKEKVLFVCCSDFSEPLAVTLGFFFASLSILHCAFGTILAGCPLKESNNRTKLSPFNCPQFLDNHQCEVIKYRNSDYFVALSSLMQFSNISVFAKRSLSSADTFVSKLKSLCATLLYLNDLFIMDN